MQNRAKLVVALTLWGLTASGCSGGLSETPAIVTTPAPVVPKARSLGAPVKTKGSLQQVAPTAAK
jgi:hypothetical protein